MDRQTLTIGAALLAVVVVGLGVMFFFLSGDDSDGPAAITGPGRAAEARGVIADIQERQAREQPPETQARPIAREPEPGAEAVEDGAGAVAVTPEPAAEAPAGAGAALDEAYDQAKEFQAAGELDNAQVLFFFNARQGHAPSAFELATMNDPLHHASETSLLEEPDAFQAYRWYTAALEGGVAAARERLDALRAWAEEAAAAGDGEAERLLLQWEE